MKATKIFQKLLLLLAVSFCKCIDEELQNIGDAAILLKFAREYRYGTDLITKNLSRACHFYEFLLERGTQDYLYPTVLLEFSELLAQDQTLSTKYNYLDLLIKAADEGSSGAQHKLSVMYSTGVANNELVPMDAGRSLLLEYMSALSGHPEANMGMGYRLLHGIGTVENCEAALPFYEYAANFAVQHIELLGYVIPPDRMRLSEATDPNQRWVKFEATQEVIDYYAHLAEKGDYGAALMLGNLYAMGSRHINVNLAKSAYFLTLASNSNNPSAAGQLGYILLQNYLRKRNNPHFSTSSLAYMDYDDDEDIILLNNPQFHFEEQFSNYFEDSRTEDEIYELLEFSSKRGDPNGMLGLGIAYYNGVGTFSDVTKAIELIQKVLTSHVDAGFYLGEILMKEGDNTLPQLQQRQKQLDQIQESFGVNKLKEKKNQNKLPKNIASATQAYTISAQMGHTLAQHRLAHLSIRGWSGSRSCHAIASGFKAVAEKGPWMKRLKKAHNAYSSGDQSKALYEFSRLAAVGVESAQYNSAYILTHRALSKKTGNAKEDRVKASHRVNPTSEIIFTDEKIEKQHEDKTRSNKIAYLNPSQWEEESLISTKTQQIEQNFEAHESKENSIWDKIEDYLDLSVDWLRKKLVPTDFNEMEKVTSEQACELRAMALFGMSAAQGNSESYLLLGDFYYYGRAGLSPFNTQSSPDALHSKGRNAAVYYYQKAAELRHTQAIFNLGLMHELGDGVRQDFHLAKRYFDQAAEYDTKAQFPRDLALVLMEGHKTLQSWIGEKGKLDLLNYYVPWVFPSAKTQKKLFRIGKKMLKLIFILDEQLKLRIEHISVWSKRTVRDFVQVQMSSLQEKLWLKPIILNLFSYIRYILENGENADIEKPIRKIQKSSNTPGVIEPLVDLVEWVGIRPEEFALIVFLICIFVVLLIQKYHRNQQEGLRNNDL